MKLLDRDTWQEVAQTLGRNKRRSIATAFGVFWGIFMLIILLALSSGFKNGVLQQTRGVSANTVFFWSSPTSKPYAGFKTRRRWSFHLNDLDLIRSRVPGIKSISSVVNTWSWGKDNLSYGGKRSRAAVSGVTPSYFEALPLDLVAGRMLSELDHSEGRKYGLLGKASAERLFGPNPADAIGKVIKANRAYYTVVGVVQSQSSNIQIGSSPDETFFLPFSVLDVAENRGGKIGAVVVVAHDDVDASAVAQEVEGVIKSIKQIAPDDTSAIETFNISEIFRLFSGFNLGIGILVWIVGIGTLLTGVVGISNILLVTVRERTQEIGVRRALGARPRDIIAQLLMESVGLTAISGLLGIVVGVGVSSGLAGALTRSTGGEGGGGFPFHNPEVDLGLVSIALAIIIASGLIAGIIPAIKAVEVKAIEAIREE